VTPSSSERFERWFPGRVLISIAVATVLLAEVVTHLPERSAVEDQLGNTAEYVGRALGTEQQWGVFAPDPRSTSLRIEARVAFEDGSTAVWHLPQGSRIGSNLRYYRWRKWLERIRSDGWSGLWEPTARWIAAEHDGGPSPVAKVELVRLFHDNVIEGPQPRYEEFTYFTYVPEPDETGR